ncbi:hypothetical protein PTKIN_Ptkin09bG0266300 [Pterospermum kingtungense]
MQNTLPNLKHSLSLTLQHFFPFAGKIKLPPPPQRHYIFFTEGDCIPFLVAESEADFNHLIGNKARHAQELQALVPKLQPPSMSSVGTNALKQYLSVSLIAIQVTTSPNADISIGITFFHAAADGRGFAHFTKSWASVCDVICHSIFHADCGDRIDLPTKYFGNCLQPCLVAAKRGELSGEYGVAAAAKAIGRAVMELDKGVLKEAEKWMSRVGEVPINSKHVFPVAGSPKLRVYDTDFGWGRPKKYGSISIA